MIFLASLFATLKNPYMSVWVGACVWEIERPGFNFVSGLSRTEGAALTWLYQTILGIPRHQKAEQSVRMFSLETAFGLKLPLGFFTDDVMAETWADDVDGTKASSSLTRCGPGNGKTVLVLGLKAEPMKKSM